MRRVVVAPNGFKGCLSAAEAARALGEGLAAGLPGWAVDEVPVADGGEGTVAALVAATGGALRTARVTGPLGEPVEASYGLLGGDGPRTAVIEMATASGLPLVPPGARDPLGATTFGTGELLRRAVEVDGCRRLVVGVGGSATTDGGAGAAQALGLRLLDATGRELGRGGAALADLDRVEGRAGVLAGVEVVVACDVDNPLCGPEGAAAVYGPQKGATPADVARLDAGLARLAEVVERDLGVAVAARPGAGAAGGLAAGLVAFAGARLERGVALVLEAVGLDERLRGADFVVTGEGTLDLQTRRDKAPIGVLRAAQAAGVPCVAVAGGLGEESYGLHEDGFAAILGATPGPMTLEEAIAAAPRLLRRTGEELGRLLALGARIGGPAARGGTE